MRKAFLFMMVSLDGFFEGVDHDLSWHNIDGEFGEFVIEQTREVGVMLFGRRTYQMMESFWPTEYAREVDPIVAELMNTTPKVVFSKTLEKVVEGLHWKNVRLVRDSVVEEIKKLKGKPGKDLAVFGSNNLSVGLLEMGLLDEIRVMVNPVVIGDGTPLFKGIKDRFKLKLFKTKTFHNGNVLLCYQPDRVIA